MSQAAPNDGSELEYTVVIEQSSNGYGAYLPDLPGCVALAETVDEVRTLIREPIEYHLELLREEANPQTVDGVG